MEAKWQKKRQDVIDAVIGRRSDEMTTEFGMWKIGKERLNPFIGHEGCSPIPVIVKDGSEELAIAYVACSAALTDAADFARLIAAAPELLAALEQALVALQATTAENLLSSSDAASLRIKAKAVSSNAIFKARGGETA